MANYLLKLIALVGCLFVLESRHAVSDTIFPQSEILIVSKSGEHKFVVDVATTMAQRQMGLMYRKNMARNRGMMFDFGEEQLIAMWMKNTLIPLDMLFVDKTGKILQIERATTPLSLETIAGRRPAMSVIELNAGLTAELGISEGDQIMHNIFFREE